MEKFKKYFYSPFKEEIVPDISEIYRYMGVRGNGDISIEAMVKECLSTVKTLIDFKVCYMLLPVDTKLNKIDFNLFEISSEDLSKNLSGCNECILFAATIGQGIDRMITRYSEISPSKALIYQAVGTEMIEKLCDDFCSYIESQIDCKLKPRFSPGYGDLTIDIQRKIFDVLNLQTGCGITLTESKIMRPSKSVTAFAGIDINKSEHSYEKCRNCTNIKCEFRKESI